MLWESNNVPFYVSASYEQGREQGNSDVSCSLSSGTYLFDLRVICLLKYLQTVFKIELEVKTLSQKSKEFREISPLAAVPRRI